VAYRYRRERLHVTFTTDKDGKQTRREEWRVESTASDEAHFVLHDGAQIWILMDGADNEALRSLGYDYEHMGLRHSAEVLEIGAEVSVLAVKQAQGHMARQREVPCLITRLAARERVRSSASSESWLFFFACLLPAIGGGFGAALWLDQPWTWDPTQVGITLVGAFACWLPCWLVGTYNRLIRLRQQVIAAFRQVDVDLAVRANLVPNLVAVVKAAAAHERELMTSLAAIRSGLDPAAATSAEGAASNTARTVLSLHERYPELTTSALYLDLHERLWACEEKLAHTRKLYNDIVKEWNDRIQSFPSSFVARIAHCLPAPYFAGDDAPLPPRLRS
jgi:LemA protein